MPRNRHVALLVPASGGYSRGICQGVASFALEHEDWLIFPYERAEFTKPPSWLKKGHIDGIIGFISTPELGRQLASLGVPIVDVQGEGNCPGVPVIDTDPGAVARLAAEFFVQTMLPVTLGKMTAILGGSNAANEMLEDAFGGK